MNKWNSSMKKQIICKWNSSNEQKIVQMRNKYFKWEKNISNEKKIFQRIKIVKMNKNN